MNTASSSSFTNPPKYRSLCTFALRTGKKKYYTIDIHRVYTDITKKLPQEMYIMLEKYESWLSVFKIFCEDRLRKWTCGCQGEGQLESLDGHAQTARFKTGNQQGLIV